MTAMNPYAPEVIEACARAYIAHQCPECCWDDTLPDFRKEHGKTCAVVIRAFLANWRPEYETWEDAQLLDFPNGNLIHGDQSMSLRVPDAWYYGCIVSPIGRDLNLVKIYVKTLTDADIAEIVRTRAISIETCEADWEKIKGYYPEPRDMARPDLTPHCYVPVKLALAVADALAAGGLTTMSEKLRKCAGGGDQ